MPPEIVAPVAVGALVVALLALLLVLLMARRVRRLTRAARSPGTGEPAVDTLLAVDRQRIESLSSDLGDLADQLRRVEAQGQRAMARVGVVRFNPFEDTGGNQSFALALLDSRSDGIVLSSLHSRQQTRVYLKAIRGGAAESALSDEEAEALRLAAGG